MTTKIAINGFGRVGRCVLRELIRCADKEISLLAVNDLTAAATLAHLLKYDSVHGKFAGEIKLDGENLLVGERRIKVLAERDPAKLPWKELGVDIVLESTGIFRKREAASAHLSAGANKVIISAPSPDPDATIVMGVNDTSYKATDHSVVSCASCTTNCLAPVARVLLDNFGIVKAAMTTIHSYTNDQKLLDLPHKDLRRARAACLSVIPTTTGAAKALGLVIPELKGKVDGFACRVPTADASLCDFVVEVERDVTVEEVNKAFFDASSHSLKGILGYSDEPLVSIDYVGNPLSSTVDAAATMVIGKRLVKVLAWYDNEMGFSNRMIDLVKLLAA